jgi:hypothetical protein
MSWHPTLGEVDLWGNDLFFHHIFSNAMALTEPDMIVVLGDVFSCEYISAEEFQTRVKRFRSSFKPVR